jgi:GWxTD domain-containing protein
MRAALLVLTLLAAGMAAAATQSEEMTPQQIQWLDDVEWILSPVEREVFLDLPASERGAFIEAFWAARDPVASTAENEFRTEHLRRVKHADEHLATGSARRGSKTDQGWAYIVLGPPKDVQRFYGRREMYPAEVWHYEGEGRPGLPANFDLVFFQPLGIGEWRLYDPTVDGPTALVFQGLNRSVNNAGAIDILGKIDAELARASLTIDVGAPHDLTGGRPDPNAGADLARLRKVAERLAPDGYARHWAQGAGHVSAAASFEPYDLKLQPQLMSAGEAGLFLHTVIELPPERVVLEQSEGRYRLALELTTVLLDRRGQEIGQKVQRAEQALDETELDRVRTRPLCVSGVLAVAPAAVRVRIVLRQPASSAIGRAEADLGAEVADAAAVAEEKICSWQIRFEREPLDAPAHRLERAEQLERAGQPALAIPELRRALETRPEPPEAALRLGRLLLELKRAREVGDLLEPRLAGVLASTGALPERTLEELALAASARVLRRDFERAAELYGRAVEAAPSSPRLLDALGAVEQARGRTERAAELYRQSLDVDPDQPKVRELLQRLQPQRGGRSP